MPVEDDKRLREILASSKTVAVVGASDKPYRDSNRIADFLIRRGYEVFPVNPAYTTTNGKKCYPDLASVPVPIDIVDVFRRADAVADVVDQAIAARAKVLWLQLDVVDATSAARAEAAGMTVVMDHCISIDHVRLVR